MNTSDTLAVAAHLHVLLRRKTGRVTDTEWMACNAEYARAIVRFACEQAQERDLPSWPNGPSAWSAPGPSPWVQPAARGQRAPARAMRRQRRLTCRATWAASVKRARAPRRASNAPLFRPASAWGRWCCRW